MGYVVGHTSSMIFIPAGDDDNQYQPPDKSVMLLAGVTSTVLVENQCSS